MERNFYNDDFEQFLKQKADQYKLYSSDRVWNNIYSSLHNRRRWLSLGLLMLLITTALLVTRKALLDNYTNLASEVTQSTLVVPTTATASPYTILHEDAEPFYSRQPLVPVDQAGNMHDVPSVSKGDARQEQPVAATLIINDAENGTLIIQNNTVPQKTALTEAADNAAGNNDLYTEEQEAADKINEALKAEDKKEKPNIQNESAALKAMPAVKSKWSIQLYASPIVSYRRLNNLNTSNKFVPVAASYGEDIDNYVHHKPAVGFEMGTKMQYAVTNSLSFYAGVQLNYSRYYIDAYNAHPERASITLSTNSLIADTVTNVTSIRNFDGSSPEQLQNQYFQVSVPLGGELKLLGNKRLQLSIAGSIQPTYLISSSSYLLSTDFKNYVQNSDLARRFNVHTNFEAFISYKTDNLKWQLGPQFRYQLLSSYSNKYPVREYLMEYGIKLGISKTIR
jgi:hypothetical protein